MKEYKVNFGKSDGINLLKAPLMPLNEYISAHKGLVIPCHDIILQYNGGLLLVRRNVYSPKDILWPLGGRIKRGMHIEDSLREKVKEECNLELEGIVGLGHVRMFFMTEPFNHGKGTDNIIFMFFGIGKGELKLDKDHRDPTTVLPKDYTQEFRKDLQPYVRDFMDLAIKLVKE
ncbi:MAG: NUDIX domain-containing protein [Candidatus Aenigmarchaeota archaeon]|nr:NUDIX domain-containing protein [Candidatus Aenigmarchaeota archaeon]